MMIMEVKYLLLWFPVYLIIKETGFSIWNIRKLNTKFRYITVSGGRIGDVRKISVYNT